MWAGNELSNILGKSLHSRKRPALSNSYVLLWSVCVTNIQSLKPITQDLPNQHGFHLDLSAVTMTLQWYQSYENCHKWLKATEAISTHGVIDLNKAESMKNLTLWLGNMLFLLNITINRNTIYVQICIRLSIAIIKCKLKQINTNRKIKCQFNLISLWPWKVQGHWHTMSRESSTEVYIIQS